MYRGKSILALVPARGGSKGLPGKNIRLLGGKPLIAWSIEAALQSSYVDAVVVSTDCAAIASTAAAHGAEIPFMRPAELATDGARSIDAILHAVAHLGESGRSFDLVLVLQPTSPLRIASDIDRAVELHLSRQADAVVSVCATDHHPWWSNTLPEDGRMNEFLRPEVINTNRQNLPDFYRLNGAIYLANAPYLSATGSFYGERTFAYVMERERSVDIDTRLDFHLAELLLTEGRRHIHQKE